MKEVQLVATGGSSISQGHCDIVLTLPFVFLMTVIFMIGISRYLRLSTTTSTSQGRRVPLFFGFCVFLCFVISLSLTADRC